MGKGQTYRARIECVPYCAVQTKQEHVRVEFSLRLRAPNEQGKWTWGAWSASSPLPKVVCEYLGQGDTLQAPTLREIRGDDGQRVAVLDLILEVPAKYVTPLGQEKRVLGFDWGIRSLITVSILEKADAGDEPYQQVSRPLFLDTGGIDGRLRSLLIFQAGSNVSRTTTRGSKNAGRSTNGATANLRIWPRICSSCWPCSTMVASSAARTSRRSRPLDTGAVCEAVSGTGAITPPCAASCGVSSDTNAISQGYERAR
jgi:hypothetical protein